MIDKGSEAFQDATGVDPSAWWSGLGDGEEATEHVWRMVYSRKDLATAPRDADYAHRHPSLDHPCGPMAPITAVDKHGGTVVRYPAGRGRRPNIIKLLPLGGSHG